MIQSAPGLTEAAKIYRKHLNPFIQYAEPGPDNQTLSLISVPLVTTNTAATAA